TDPSLSTTLLDEAKGGMARLLPTPRDAARLRFWGTGGDAAFDVLTIHADGTLPENPAERLLGALVKSPPLPSGVVVGHLRNALVGPVFTCEARDGTHFYLSGAYAAV